MAVFLKSLDIFGFKSFADKTHIEFADGITALVGPNGCGKSNVVDAIKWVLAESRAKMLRASTMEDVIFNGTELRGPLNVAEVTLTIMNEDGKLPLDAPEIAIKRRLYRSGECEYFINGAQVGAREVRRLFMDTGVGKSAYSVMEQGKIDQILSSRPEDRRYLFEEAAGISRSKEECRETEKELERTRVNMGQLEVSVAEAKTQYDALSVQAERTKKWRELKDSIFYCERDAALVKLKGAMQAKERGEAQLAVMRQKQAAVHNEIERLTNELMANKDAIDTMQSAVSDKQADLIGLQKEKLGKQELIRQYGVRAADAKEKIAQLDARRGTITDEVERLTGDIDEESASLYGKEKQLLDAQRNIQSFENDIEEASSQMGVNDKKVEEANNEIKALGDEAAKMGRELALITEDVVRALDERLKGAGLTAATLGQKKTALDMAISSLKVYVAGRQKILGDGAKIDCAELLSKIEHLAGGVEAALADYVAASPAFLVDFLSPEGIITKKRAVDERIAQNARDVDAVRERTYLLRDANEQLVKKVSGYRDTLSRLKVNEARMTAQKTASEEKVALLRRTLSNQRVSLLALDGELATETQKAEDIAEEVEGLKEDLDEIEKKGKAIADELKELDQKIALLRGGVTGAETDLKARRDEEAAFAAQCEKISSAISGSDTEIRLIKQNFQDTHSRDLMEAAGRMDEITESSVAIRTRLANSKEALRQLGEVNHMAIDQAREALDRYNRLQKGYDDLAESMKNLERVSAEIKARASASFVETYNQIRRNFHNMFRRLFNGGRAQLRLVDSENVLTSGIDIFAQPPGKKLENIMLLSGGEKTMTAVALLFATYQVRPSPFCLLDEIDAALDDRNVSCFASTLRSFSKLSQYIVITHNRHTIVGTARTMIGVTMQESGVSGVLSYPIDPAAVPKEEDGEDGFVEEDVEAESVTLPERPGKRV